MKAEVLPLSRHADLLIQDLGDEMLVYDLNLNKAFSLNNTCSVVWQECDGKKTVSQISQAVGKKLKTSVNADLVWFAIDELKKMDLMDNGNDLISDFNNVSRRDAIKKVGMGTMIALPVISSLVAPTAAVAGSACTATCQNGVEVNTCVRPNEVCCGGICRPADEDCGLSC